MLVVSVLVANMFFTMRPGHWPFKISNFKRVLAPLTLWMEVSTATSDDIDLQDLKRDSFCHGPHVISKPFYVFLKPTNSFQEFHKTLQWSHSNKRKVSPTWLQSGGIRRDRQWEMDPDGHNGDMNS